MIVEEHLTNPANELIIKKYVKGRFLGKGGFAKCYEFKVLERNQILAAKVISKVTLKKNRHRQKLLSEIRIHRSLNHSHIVKFDHVFEDNKNVYILLEMCANQTLNNLCKRRRRLTEFEARYYVFQMVHALRYLHKNKVIHRDLKLGNLFLSESLQVKVGDFGLAARLKSHCEKRHTVCGTPNYLAPEVLNSSKGHSYEVDIWSLGVVLFALVTGKPPFETPEVEATYERIRQGHYRFPRSARLSRKFKNLVRKIFQLDPLKRPSLGQILEDPFINRGRGIPKAMQLSTLSVAPNQSYIDRVRAVSDSREGQVELRSSRVHVHKWLDFSSKYGLGYCLSNKCSGVFFNDCSKMVFHPAGKFFQYIERSPDKVTKIQTYALSSYPEEMHKKVTLLLHFRSYLEGKKPEQCAPDVSAEELGQKAKDKYLGKACSMVYVKKWMKTKHATLLRLSNKIVQVTFNDKTEIILSSESKLVTYVNKKGHKLEYAIGNAMDSDNAEMSRRLKYAKDILMHMLNNKIKK